ncbi:MAG: 3-deoxy-manno-octulosonate cytidylyltransferase [Deferribacteraceae bacterium]|jgi:3-deoxy-manno-octulosonate cytidylyltransferase (CMP-KDO synthetase)|nr:3-deoxy-manno-octulosonate cytidylyltransferase [Deferribacteraceae bacterium]
MAVVIIPARYSSSRFPGKLIASLGGEPLITHTIKSALKSRADSVCLVTDDERIVHAVSALKAAEKRLNILMSDPAICTGTDRVAFAAKNIHDEIIINVQGDEPFIPPKLLDELIALLEKDADIGMASACVPIENADAANNPNHVKAVFDNNNFALYFSRLPIPSDRDNKKPTRYKHIGIYAFRRETLFRFASLRPTPLEAAEMLEQLRALENGIRIKMLITDYLPISVDTLEDLEKAEAAFRTITAFTK